MPARLAQFDGPDDIRCDSNGDCWQVVRESQGTVHALPVAATQLSAAQQAAKARITAHTRNHHAANLGSQPAIKDASASDGLHGTSVLPAAQLHRLSNTPNATAAAPRAGNPALPYATAKGRTVTIHHADGSVESRTGTHPFRDNNPGDLVSGYGAIGLDHGGGNTMAIYDTSAAGWEAMKQTLQTKYADLSILDTMKKYCPEFDRKGHRIPGNNPVQYAQDIADAAGVTVKTLLKQLTPAELDIVQHTIAGHEGYDAPGSVHVTPAPGGSNVSPATK